MSQYKKPTHFIWTMLPKELGLLQLFYCTLSFGFIYTSQDMALSRINNTGCKTWKHHIEERPAIDGSVSMEMKEQSLFPLSVQWYDWNYKGGCYILWDYIN